MYLLDKNFCPSVETKPDPRSIEGLIAWLETMPADDTYKWGCAMCLYGQYGRALDLFHRDRSDDGFYMGAIHAFASLPENNFDGLSEPFGALAIRRPHTFGAALGRARLYQASVRT